MQLLISDANILIDMVTGQLLEAMFALPDSFVTPDVLFAEELQEQHPELPEMGLLLGELSPVTMGYAEEFMQRYPGPSRMDCVALALARQETCPLLTGDKALRTAADKENVPIKGTLWLLERMLAQAIIDPLQARAALDAMRAAGRRLPWKQCEAMVANFEH